jgi:hypothetical protein
MRARIYARIYPFIQGNVLLADREESIYEYMSAVMHLPLAARRTVLAIRAGSIYVPGCLRTA